MTLKMEPSQNYSLYTDRDLDGSFYSSPFAKLFSRCLIVSDETRFSHYTCDQDFVKVP